MSRSDKDTTDGCDLSTLGRFIRSQRQLAKLSQRELARLADLSDPYISQIERGLHTPSLRVLTSLASALNLRAETLLTYAGLTDNTADSNSDTHPSTEAAILADPALTTEQRQALLSTYQAFIQANSG